MKPDAHTDGSGCCMDRERLIALLHQMPDPVVLIDRGMRVTFANETANRMFGFTAGDKCHESAMDSVAVCRECPVTMSFNDSSVKLVQKRIKDSGGESRYMDFSAAPFREADGSVRECILVGRDATAGREREEHKKDMLCMMSHDLKTPLAVIGFSAEEMAGDTAGLSLRQIELLEKIKSAAANTRRLLDDFVTLSKLESGNMEITPVPVPLSLIVSYTVDSLSHVIKEADAHVHVGIPGELPSAMLDLNGFGRVVTNVLVNALKYGGDGVHIKIRAGLAARPGELYLEVEDDGPGIAEESLPRIFDRYYRGVDCASADGSGLGLAIVKTIVGLHGGSVDIRSAAGEGTTVRMLLPAEQRPEAAGATAPSTP